MKLLNKKTNTKVMVTQRELYAFIKTMVGHCITSKISHSVFQPGNRGYKMKEP